MLIVSPGGDEFKVHNSVKAKKMINKLWISFLTRCVIFGLDWIHQMKTAEYDCLRLRKSCVFSVQSEGSRCTEILPLLSIFLSFRWHHLLNIKIEVLIYAI